MTHVTIAFAMIAVVLVMALTGIAQHRYYGRTVRRLAAAHNRPGSVLVSGRGKSRMRGAIVVLVLRTEDDRIEAAALMEGATVLARFVERPDWVGCSVREPLPKCSTRAAAAVADALTRVPGRRSAPTARPRWAPPPRGGRR